MQSVTSRVSDKEAGGVPGAWQRRQNMAAQRAMEASKQPEVRAHNKARLDLAHEIMDTPIIDPQKLVLIEQYEERFGPYVGKQYVIDYHKC